MSLEYWSYGKSPLMKVSLNNNTLRARCFEEEGNIRNAISIWIIFVVYRFSQLVTISSMLITFNTCWNY